jgi:hypothetical protein
MHCIDSGSGARGSLERAGSARLKPWKTGKLKFWDRDGRVAGFQIRRFSIFWSSGFRCLDAEESPLADVADSTREILWPTHLSCTAKPILVNFAHIVLDVGGYCTHPPACGQLKMGHHTCDSVLDA